VGVACGSGQQQAACPPLRTLYGKDVLFTQHTYFWSIELSL